MFRINQTPAKQPAMSPSPNMPPRKDKPLPELPQRDSSRRNMSFFRNVLRPRSTRIPVPEIIVTTPEGVEMSIRDAPPWREARPQDPRKSRAKGDANVENDAEDDTPRREGRGDREHRTSSRSPSRPRSPSRSRSQSRDRR
ncbi:hypothetical protein CDV36_008632 [Fusarium kuroshium]|uniref:Uncharacterized protein n=1 Tax=Fusarium kuroshium TaxID=2010991 RepID=A0A3M2S2K4_9HYPO|nr:hypothetical protein CDV36_008632 [Fusarium kuroshium]